MVGRFCSADSIWNWFLGLSFRWMVSLPKAAAEVLCTTSLTNSSPTETLRWSNGIFCTGYFPHIMRHGALQLMSPFAKCFRIKSGKFIAKGSGFRRIHRWEFRQSLGQASHWKALRHIIHTGAGQVYASQPPLDEFADAPGKMFSGIPPDRDTGPLLHWNVRAPVWRSTKLVTKVA